MSTGTASPANDKFFYDLYLAGYYEINFKLGLVRNAKTKKVYRRGPNGYVEVPKKTDGGKKGILSHRLIWMAHNGRLIRPGYEINHKDGDKSNCRPGNLEEATPSQNSIHARQTGLRLSIKGRRSEKRLLSDKQVTWARKAHKTGKVSTRQLSLKFDMAMQSVRDMLKGKLYADV